MFAHSQNNDSANVVTPNRFLRITLVVVRNIFGPSGLFMPLLLFALVFRFLGLVVLLYAVVNTIGLILIITRTSERF